jgi:membrane protein implicated in regulation of membrane protease activity
MDIKDVILLSIGAALIIVGIQLSFTQGAGVSYPVFMFAVAFLFWFKYRRNIANERENQQNLDNQEKPRTGKVDKRKR